VETLGLMDQMFYKADQHSVASMVMGGASILKPVPHHQPLQAKVIRDHIAARLEKVPLLRKKFVQDPLRLGSVAKVEDPEFDIGKHMVISSLPSPGGYRELTAALAEVSSRPLAILDTIGRPGGRPSGPGLPDAPRPVRRTGRHASAHIHVR
jgi:diacylglycerol O-acyltransferase